MLVASICILTFVIDVVSKAIVVNNIALNESVTVISKFFYLTYVENTGIAFSFLEGHVAFIAVMSVIVLLMVFRYLKNCVSSKLESICYGMIIGGALGNLFDRIRYGYVIDFLDFHILDFHYPIFNFADVFIVVGVVLIVISSLRKEKYFLFRKGEE